MREIQSGGDHLAALKAASSLLAESGGPDGHITPEDEELFREVIEIVNNTIYDSMDDSHNADVAACDAAVATAAACNADIEQRQSAEGDLGVLQQRVTDKQIELDRLQGVVDDAVEANNTAWNDFNLHMQQIAPAPECPDFPARTMPALDVYFEESLYSIWFTAQQDAYNDVRAVFAAADKALIAANRAYNIQRAVRDVQYCDWKSELDAACLAYVTCFVDASNHYRLELVPRVRADINSRIEIFKAGETLVHQINFLLGDVASQDTPAIDPSRYELDFPSLPGRVRCDQSVLTSPTWNPPIVCFEQEFKLVGEGWCQTPLSQTGTHTVVEDVTLDACREQCFADRSCIAIEFSRSTGNCELHSAFVDRVEANSNGLCLAKTIPFSLVGEGWCRTPSRREGTHFTIQAQTEGACLDLCRAEESCLGVEFDVDGRRRHECELHTQFVDRVEPHNHGICLTKQSTFSLLGEGWCRTPSGEEGTRSIASAQSEGQCLALCRADDSCLAVEFNTEKEEEQCELHSALVDRVEANSKGLCLLKD